MPARSRLPVALAILLLLVPGVVGLSVTTMGATLPARIGAMPAIFDGAHVYVFGGELHQAAGTVSTITRFDPVADTALVVAQLPQATAGSSAIWDGSHAYVFGGTNLLNPNVVRFDPTTNSVTTMPSAFARSGTSAVWTGTHAYIFGGSGSQGPHFSSDEIVRYDPATDTFTTMTATLPSPRAFTAAAWDGTHVYVFGGTVANFAARFDEILRYDPVTDTLNVTEETLPTPRLGMGAVWDGARITLFGGNDANGFLTNIHEYDPATDTLSIVNATLPEPVWDVPAVWDGTHAFLLGGFTGVPTATDRIVRFTPGDASPPETFIVNATDGHGLSLPQGGSTVSPSVSLTFHGTDNRGVVGFECSLDDAAFAPCANPETFTVATLGPHNVSVRARDAAGNVDPTPAFFHWVRTSPVRGLEDLIANITEMVLDQGTQTSLVAPPETAHKKLTDGNPNNDGAACGSMGAFLNQVAAKRGNGQLTSLQADILDARGRSIRDALEC